MRDDTANLTTNVPGLVKTGLKLGDVCEATPVVWQRRLLVLVSRRWVGKPEPQHHYLEVRDEHNVPLCTFGHGHSLASAFVWQNRLHVYAPRLEDDGWHDVEEYTSDDLVHWQGPRVVIQGDGGEELFNQSVCWDGRRFVMAYESNDSRWPAFTNKFAESADLVTWHKIPDLAWAPDRYTACPCLRFSEGWYYMMYLEHRSPRWWFETCLVRSRDLAEWEPSPHNPILAPNAEECCNTSDPDVVEWQGRVLLYYSYGDQRSWSELTRAEYPGTLAAFYRACYA